MKLYDTLSRQIKDFKPLSPPEVTFYSCGPTVYDYTHIGHIRTFINNDVLKRTLTFLGYKVKHVMNITDVGHLTGDNDHGEDKMEKGAKKNNKTVWEVAKFYTDFFLKTIDAVNIIRPDTLCKATDNIEEMIKMIKVLLEKKLAYETEEAVYFDVSKFPKYGQLSCQKPEEKIKGSREEVYLDKNKKNPADFSLWFKRTGRFADHSMHWPSPWGEGFPGWHIECSAMSGKYLGDTIDIHSGGIDHISVHHENEIAQSESATGKLFVKYWFHNNFLTVEGQKMSKSLNNFFTIDDVVKKGIDPLAIRLLFLQTHYRQASNFTWNSAMASQEAYKKLRELVIILRKQTSRSTLSEDKLLKIDEYRQRFIESISNDLQTPQAVATMWEMLKSNIPSTDKLDLLFEFDRVLGLKLNEVFEEKTPEEVLLLKEEYEKSRSEKNFTKSDELRRQISLKGYEIRDSNSGTVILKR